MSKHIRVLNHLFCVMLDCNSTRRNILATAQLNKIRKTNVVDFNISFNLFEKAHWDTGEGALENLYVLHPQHICRESVLFCFLLCNDVLVQSQT